MGTGVDLTAITPGMAVYDAHGAPLGQVEEVQSESIGVLGHAIPASAITRVDAAGVHLLLAHAAFAALRTLAADTATGTATHGEQLVIPLVEERLVVGTREIAIGEITIRKRVVEEERMVPVTIRREEITIVRREAGQPWPTDAGEAGPDDEVTRIPLHAEEQVITLRQVVAREVVIEKGRVAEDSSVTDTVRREHVEVEERYLQERPRLLAEFTAGQARATDPWARERTFEQAEPQYRAGFAAANDPRHADRDFAEVEPDLRQGHAADGRLDNDQWKRLRAEIHAGWEAARRR